MVTINPVGQLSYVLFSEVSYTLNWATNGPLMANFEVNIVFLECYSFEKVDWWVMRSFGILKNLLWKWQTTAKVTFTKCSIEQQYVHSRHVM